jgi:hypothetical protein
VVQRYGRRIGFYFSLKEYFYPIEDGLRLANQRVTRALPCVTLRAVEHFARAPTDDFHGLGVQKPFFFFRFSLATVRSYRNSELSYVYARATLAPQGFRGSGQVFSRGPRMVFFVEHYCRSDALALVRRFILFYVTYVQIFFHTVDVIHHPLRSCRLTLRPSFARRRLEEVSKIDTYVFAAEAPAKRLFEILVDAGKSLARAPFCFTRLRCVQVRLDPSISLSTYLYTT